MNFERLVQRTAATLLMSMICLISLAQSRTVSGVVLDSRGDPVIGANIRVVSDASIGTIKTWMVNSPLPCRVQPNNWK